MSIKINKLEIENVKRVKAVKIEPSTNGLTIIGGKNNQGKTSVLDAIAWTLGGERVRPSQAAREGSTIPPNLRIVMNNGLVVERKGKNSSLKVTDPSGQKAGQQLLDGFVEQLALNLPKFMEANSKEKANTLLQIIGIGPQLAELERQEKEMFNERTYIGRTADQKEKYAKEQPYFPDVPSTPISASELIRQQQEILAQNGENQRKRECLHRLEQEYQQVTEQIQALLHKQEQLDTDLKIARGSAESLADQSTAELEQNIADIEETNRKVRANLDKDKAEEDAKEYRAQYNTLTTKIEAVRKQKDNMSGSEQLRVSTAIVRRLNPDCGFVLLDKLEQMDLDTLQEFGQWLEQEGLQAIATRVSTGDECSIIIEDGYVAGQDMPAAPEPPKQTGWKAGDF